MTASHTGVLIIRAWIEEGSEQPLRATIRYTTDISARAEHSLTLTDVDAVCQTIRWWLQDVLDDQDH